MAPQLTRFKVPRSLSLANFSATRRTVLSTFVAICLLATPLASVMPPATVRAANRPNIILILTDDQNIDTMRFMPQTKRLLGRQGVRFTQYYDNISLCCAARASLLRGQYAQNTGVFDNQLPNGAS